MTRRLVETALVILCLAVAPLGVFLVAGAGSVGPSPVAQARSMMLAARLKPATCVQRGVSDVVVCSIAEPTCGSSGSSDSASACVVAVVVLGSADGGAIRCPQGPLFVPRCRVTVPAGL